MNSWPVAVQKFFNQCKLRRQLKRSELLHGNGMGPDRMQVLSRLSKVQVRDSESDCSFIDCLDMTSLVPMFGFDSEGHLYRPPRPP